MSDTAVPPLAAHAAARATVVAAALELFASQGFDQTSVEQIAQAAGVSRSTFFRQFGGKDDVVFADHELLLGAPARVPGAAARRTRGRPCAKAPVRCSSTSRPIPSSRGDGTPSSAGVRRFAIVRSSPSSATSACSTSTCAASLPGLDPLDAVGFAALVTAVHNHVLRQLLRGTEERADRRCCAAHSTTCSRRFGVHADSDPRVAMRRRTTSSSPCSPARCRPPRWPGGCGRRLDD